MPIKRKELIRKLRKAGFSKPKGGQGGHMIMKRGQQRLPIPNPHQGDISDALLDTIVERIGMTREEWDRL